MEPEPKYRPGQILITYVDDQDLPRAWATGDDADSEEVAKDAKDHAAQYVAEHPDNPLKPEPKVTRY